MRWLCPDELRSSVTDIDLAALGARGIQGLILDVDNTLVAYDQQAVSAGIVAWVRRARAAGLRLCIVSNGLGRRVGEIARGLGVPAVARAGKPRGGAFRQALTLLDLPPGRAAVVGDQLFTDVLGGKRLGLYVILVNPLTVREFPTTRLVRHLERRILYRCERRGLLRPDDLRVRFAVRACRPEGPAGP